MANFSFKINGGDFPKGKGYYQEPMFSEKCLVLPARWLGKHTIPIAKIDSIEKITEDMIADGMTKAEGVLAGGLLFGPLGAIAGAAAGGAQKKEIAFAVTFADGKSLIGTADAAVFKQLKLALIESLSARTAEKGKHAKLEKDRQEKEKRAQQPAKKDPSSSPMDRLEKSYRDLPKLKPEEALVGCGGLLFLVVSLGCFGYFFFGR